jgi:hypothetical protein
MALLEMRKMEESDVTGKKLDEQNAQFSAKRL